MESEVPSVSCLEKYNGDADGCVREFFPATSDGFVAKCGTVEAIRASDFDDIHRRRHLESFKKSWNEWATYDANDKNKVNDATVSELVLSLIEAAPQNQQQFDSCLTKLRRHHHVAVSKSQMLAAYEKLILKKSLPRVLDQFLVKKVVRTHSGVVVITVLTSPGTFSCPKDCHYCPNEPGQPRSYLSTEPAVLRANQNGWDAALQFWDRASTLYHNGHIIDKIEVLVLGGTWSGYPKSYQEEFCRDLFYAANAFNQFLEKEALKEPVVRENAVVSAVPEGMRPRLSLEEEQQVNEGSDCRIIGLTLETRPDHISRGELRRLRRFGCTRVQIGIQHTNDEILTKINRGCSRADGVRALQLLKDGCFKVDIHLMPDLPGSSPYLDKLMFEDVLSSPDMQADQWKIYPCEVTPFSQIEQWYKQGIFVPYAEHHEGRELNQLLVKVKTAVHPWLRLNRVVRDIPNPSIIAGNDKTNLRQVLLSCMKKRNLTCRCLRCREVKTTIFDALVGCLKVRQYEALGGEEYFLSFETENEKNLFGFLRLRLRNFDLQPNEVDIHKINKTFPELEGCGLIRELHVYGQLVGSKERKSETDIRPQHTGYGRRLLAAAELITNAKGLKKMAVIAGVGTRDYYRKFGYECEGFYMTKKISRDSVYKWSNELGLKLPLGIQLYSMATDLGDLDTELIEDDIPNVKTPPNVKVLDVSVRSNKKRNNKKNNNENRKPDLLSPLGTNCSAKKLSHSTQIGFISLNDIRYHPIEQNDSILYRSMTYTLGAVILGSTLLLVLRHIKKLKHGS